MTQGNVNLKLGLDTSPATTALQQYYKKLNQGASQAASSQKAVTTSLEKVVASAKKLGLTYDKVNKSFKDSKGAVQTLQQVKQRVDSLNASLAKTQQAANTALSGIGAGFKQVLSGIPQGIGLAIGQQLLAPLTNFGSVLKDAVGGAVQTFVDIDEALRQTASISGATTAEFAELQSAVINLAKDTKFTTGELANASIALARAGFTAQEVQEALPGVAEGAAAAGQSMDQMADTVIGAMGGFQKGTEETIDVVDVLTQTANMSNQSVTDLGEALKYVGPIANGLGLTLEDTSAALGLLANAGIRGSQAGTTLRSGLSRLAAAAAGNNSEFADLSRGTGRLAETLQRLGADVVDTNGDLLAFPELLKTLKASLGDLSANEQQLVSKILFGEEAAAGFRALLATTVEDIEGFAQATNNATGVAKETSEQNLAGIAGSLTFLSSAFDAASAKVGEFLGAILKPLVDGLTLVLNAFNNLPGPIQNVIIGVTGLTLAAGAATIAMVAFQAASKAGIFVSLVNAVTTAATSFGALAAAIKAQAIAALTGLGSSFTALSSLMTTQISLTGALAAIKAKLGIATATATTATVASTAAYGGATTAATGFATSQTAIATTSTAAAGGVKAFIAAALPIAALAAAVLSVAAAWDTFNTVFGGSAEIQKIAASGITELDDALKEYNATIKESEKSTENANTRWNAAVGRVGAFQAALDILRDSLGLATAEEARLSQETVALYEKFEESEQQVDALTSKYGEVAAAMADGSSAKTRAQDMETLQGIEEAVVGTLDKQIKALEDHRKKHVETSGGIKAMTQAEKDVLTAINAKISSLVASKDLLEALKNKYVETGAAATAFGDAVANIPDPAAAVESTKAALDDAKNGFQNNIKAMESSFDSLQSKIGEGVTSEVNAIKSDISSMKDEAKVFENIKQGEISAIQEISAANEQAAAAAIQAAQRSGAAEVAAMERAMAAADRTHQKKIANMQKLAEKEQATFNKQIENANKASEAAIRSLEAQQQAADRALASAVKNVQEEIKLSNKKYDQLTQDQERITEEIIKNLNEQQQAAERAYEAQENAAEKAFEATQAAAKQAYEAQLAGIQDLLERENERYDNRIKRVRNGLDSTLSAMKAEGEADAQLTDKKLANLDRQKDRSNDFYDEKIAAANRAHDTIMDQYDRELDAINTQKDAVNDRYDSQLNRLKQLTPAEQQLRAIRIAGLMDTAENGATNEERLRAQATLERMQLDEQAAVLRARRQQEIRALEEKAEQTREAAREREETHQQNVEALQAERAEKELELIDLIEKTKEKAAKEQEARELAMEKARTEALKRIEDLEENKDKNAKARMKEIDDLKKSYEEAEETRQKGYDEAKEIRAKEFDTNQRQREADLQKVREDNAKALEQIDNDRAKNEEKLLNDIDKIEAGFARDAEKREADIQKIKTDNIEAIEKLKDAAATAEDKRMEDIEKEKDNHVTAQEKREDDILKKKDENADKAAKLENDLQKLKDDNAGKVKTLEDEIQKKKEDVAVREKELIDEIGKKEDDEKVRLEKAEEDFLQVKKDLTDDFVVAIGEAHDDILTDGDDTWEAYATNAIEYLGKVKQAAQDAKAAVENAAAAEAAAPAPSTATPAAAAPSSPSGGGLGFVTRWSGGPVSAGQKYTVNELGQEAFKSSTGKLSLIDAPAFGTWKAPSKGTVINAAETEKLALNASTESLVSSGAVIDPTGGHASQHVPGNESRNLLRAIAKATGGDNITNHVTIQSANTTQAASDMMVELTKIKRRRLR